MRLSWQDLFEKLPFPVEEEYPWAILDGLDRFLQGLPATMHTLGCCKTRTRQAR